MEFITNESRIKYKIKRHGKWYIFFIILASIASCKVSSEKEALNILFISVDDLRPELNCYGSSYIHSPNMDKIASEGALFQKHFTQVPTCGASRYCLLTGIRPTTKSHLNNDIIEKTISNSVEGKVPETFIHHLKRNGYETIGIGKISHSADGYLYGYEEEVSDKKELPYSWDQLLFNPGKWQTGWNAFFAYSNGENRQSLKKQVKPYESSEVEDDGYPDGLTTQLALNKIKELKNNSNPFFLGVGFFKPHLPFNAPKKYWDLYNRDSLPLSINPTVPENVHPASLHNSSEFNQYKRGDEVANLEHPLSDEYSLKLRHAYYASISYIDYQIGQIYDELAAQGLAKNTVIVIWGDHGWHLGEQQMWGKHSLFENALRSTLIIKVPSMPVKNMVIPSIVETVDIYPTLMELAGIPIEHKIDGKSFLNKIYAPNKEEVNEVAYGYFRNGITLRTDQYRMTKYYRKQQPSIELYDHSSSVIESKNIAQDRSDIVAKLMPLLEKGNKGIYE